MQHRMRPTIARLLVPNIYKRLDCHPSVHQYEEIRGIDSSVFFLDHKFDFQDKHAANSTSFVNVTEAEFAIALCQYLLQQNYHPSRITILAAYKGQVELMKDKVENNVIFNEVRITSIDDYQGEENDIIILSLVRSNFNSKAGFLTIENRVCVALSRARMGLYAIGNFRMLNKIHVWHPIIRFMQIENQMGPLLRIFCQNHPRIKFNVRVAKDFAQVPNGGCGLPCEYIYPECRHRCQLLCHHVDMEHVRVCELKCGRKCPRGHPCQKLCCEPCGSCEVEIGVSDLNCTHPYIWKCGETTDVPVCQKPCERRLKCGHMCTKMCKERCSSCCGEVVRKKFVACGHDVILPCGGDYSNIKCTKKCEDILPCGHACKKLCGEPCGPCTVSVTRSRPNCSHPITVQCQYSDDLSLSSVKCESRILMKADCGHLNETLCYKGKHELKCTKQCSAVLPCEYKYPECGHRCQLLCHPLGMVHEKVCELRCGRKCPRGHPCQKPCGEPCGPCVVSVTRSCPKCLHPITVQCQHSDDLSLSNVKCESRILMKAGCGHLIETLCYKGKPGLKCTKQCSAILPCRHNCHGKCQDCSPRDGIQMHDLCKEICYKPLLCGHFCGLTCSEDCLQCTSTCGLSCSHRVCVLPCGANCVPCTKPCTWKCPHYKCTKLCHEPCNRPKCNMRCNKLLPCLHRCLGLCGEQCPKACRKCSPQDFVKYPLDTCFVQLTDCDHIIPADELDALMNPSASTVMQRSVGYMSCPQCKVCIRSNSRYGNELKVTSMVVAKIREQLRDSHMKHKVYDKLTSIPHYTGLMFEMKMALGYIDNFSMCDSDLITLRKITSIVNPLCSRIKHIQVSNALEALSDWVREWRIEMQRSGFKRKKLEELYLRINRVKLMKQLLNICEINSCQEDALRVYRNVEQNLFDKKAMKQVELEVRQLASRGNLVKQDPENFFEEPSVLYTWDSFGWKICGGGHCYQLRGDDEVLVCPECCANRSPTKKCLIQ